MATIDEILKRAATPPPTAGLDRDGYTNMAVNAYWERVAYGITGAGMSAAESAISLIQSCFRTIKFEPMSDRLPSANLLADAVREVLATGEMVWWIEVNGEMVDLIPASSWSIRSKNKSSYAHKDWLYDLTMPAPSSTVTKQLRKAEEVCHFRYSCDRAQPWHGRGPLDRGRLTAILADRLERGLADEANLPSSVLVPIPGKLDKDKKDNFRSMIEQARGKVIMSGIGISPPMPKQQMPPYKSDYQSITKLRPDPAEALVQHLRPQLEQSIYNLFGVPSALLSTSLSTGSADVRDSLRVFIYTKLRPLAKMFETELKEKLDLRELRIDFSELESCDIRARATGLKSMLEAGVELQSALKWSGFPVEDK